MMMMMIIIMMMMIIIIIVDMEAALLMNIADVTLLSLGGSSGFRRRRDAEPDDGTGGSGTG